MSSGAGDGLELRGPIGGWFAWETKEGGPLLLVAGGSGIAPLMAMIRHRRAASNDAPVRLLFSTRSYEDIIFREDLERYGGALCSVRQRPDPPRPPGRRTATLLAGSQRSRISAARRTAVVSISARLLRRLISISARSGFAFARQ